MANYTRYSVKYGVLLSGLMGVSLLAGCGSTTASFAVTDAPVDDVESIKVTFTRLDLKPAQGDPISVTLDEPVVIDNLLALTSNAAAPIVNDIEVEPGEYQWVRLYVDGGIPDSLACVETDAYYFGSFYLYEGDLTAEGSAEPGDVYDPGIEGGSDEVQDAAGERPVTTANVVFDEDSATLRYEIGFVRANEEGYSLAYSCNAKGDDPATDDDIPYTEVKYTTVEVGGTAMVDFSVVPQAEGEPVESE